jgi:hypothetical protein
VLIGNDREFCKKRFLDYFDQISTILKHTRKIFLYWDNVEYDLPKSVTDQILIYNKFHIDNSLSNNMDTFGTKSHLYISKIIIISMLSINLPTMNIIGDIKNNPNFSILNKKIFEYFRISLNIGKNVDQNTLFIVSFCT